MKTFAERTLATKTFEGATPRLALALLLLGCLMAAASVTGQVPSDAVLQGFVPNGDLLMEIEGEVVPNLELYHSDRSGTFLAMAPSLASPILLSTRTGSVEKVHLMKVRKQPDGTIDLAADAALDRISSFQIVGTELHFELEGKSAKFKAKPPLLGYQQPAELRSYKPSYESGAVDYQPNPAALEALKGLQGDVKVLVYFGTWCPTCGRLVPKVLRIDEELGDAGPNFEYYGLPHDMTTDPAARRDEIHGVPTALVLVDGKEKARFGVRELNNPEVHLRDLLR